MADASLSLSSAQRATLQNSQRLRKVGTESATALATGRKANRLGAEPVERVLTKVLSDQVAALGEAKGQISLTVGAAQTAGVGLETIEQYSRQLKSIAFAASSAQTAEERAVLSEQFNQVRAQIDNVVTDTTFGQNPLLVTTSSRLGIGDPDSDYNGLTTTNDINAAIADVESAIAQVRSTHDSYATELAINGIRDNFNDGFSTTLQSGIDKLVNADLNEEAARNLSAQVRGNLSNSSQRILAQGDSLVLNLFS